MQMSALLSGYASHGLNAGLFATGDAAACLPMTPPKQDLLIDRSRVPDVDSESSDGLSDSEGGL